MDILKSNEIPKEHSSILGKYMERKTDEGYSFKEGIKIPQSVKNLTEKYFSKGKDGLFYPKSSIVIEEEKE